MLGIHDLGFGMKRHERPRCLIEFCQQETGKSPILACDYALALSATLARLIRASDSEVTNRF
jgi:hypothetical protein